jgi:NAD(P)-dependent dehydrogenase (short-subunit alcohol dehydrogenase family)
MEQLRFDGRSAIVTGGGRGVGRCHALLLAARGARVVVADAGVELDGSGWSRTPADEVVDEIRSAGGEAVACTASVADETGAQAIVQTALDAFGRLDIVVNNAGIHVPWSFDDLTAEQFRTLLGVHYLGTVYVTQAAWPHLRAAGYGRIVNTCSEGSFGIHEKLTAYGGAKGGVYAFTLNLAAESTKYGITVNGVCPRPLTRMSAPELLAQIYDQPVEHFRESMSHLPPELVSPAAAYFAHESCQLNGIVLVSGGGQVLRVAVVENDGFTTSDPLTPEHIASNLDTILDMTTTHVMEVGYASATVREHG